MTREQIKIALPLILAFAEGKTIQIKNRSRWIDIDGDKDELNLDSVVAYQDCFRIKPNDVYLPFRNAEEWRRHNPRAKNKVTRIKLFRN